MIIVPDFKTFVSGMVNYLDVNTLDIQEKKMEIEIEHMDGAGIFIPGTFPCSCQIRGGWLKGAVFPFDFHKFIEKYRDKVSAANMIDAYFASYIGCGLSKCTMWFKGERKLNTEQLQKTHEFLSGKHIKTVEDIMKEE